MFNYDSATGAVTMHQGDTGAYKVRATRESGESWTEDDRMLFTVQATDGTIVMQRFYRLDDDDGLGNGVVEIQFHNNDTDKWPVGMYAVERRYVVNPYWSGDAPDGMCVNALTAGVRMLDGDIVRVPVTGQTTLTITGIYGEV